MKIKIVTYADKRPDFIEPQLRSIKKFVKDTNYEFIVFNNAVDSVERSAEIEKVCKDLNVESIKVILDEDLNKMHNETNFSNGAYVNANVACAYPIIWSWKNHITKWTDSLLCIIDSDMFFINDVCIETMMSGYNFSFVPQYKKTFQVYYPWNGLVFANMAELPSSLELDWFCGKVLGEGVDVGGQGHFYLEKFKKDLNVLFLEAWNMSDIEKTNPAINLRTFKTHLNGNARFNITLKEKEVLKMMKLDTHLSKKRTFPYQNEVENYEQLVVSNFLEIEEWINKNGLEFPKPTWFDLIKTRDQKIQDSFVFHYKSGSNYNSFSTAEYNTLKTVALNKLLG